MLLGSLTTKGFRTVCNSGDLSKVYTIERNSEFRHDPSRLMKSFFVSCGIRVAVSRPGLDHTLDPKHEIRTAASDRHTCLDDSEGWIHSSLQPCKDGYAEAEVETSRSRAVAGRTAVGVSRFSQSSHTLTHEQAVRLQLQSERDDRGGSHSHGVSMLPIPMPSQDVGTRSAERILLCCYSSLLDRFSFHLFYLFLVIDRVN